MIEGLLNMMFEPFYTAFDVFDISNNLCQLVLILMFVLGVINWVCNLIFDI